MSPHEGIKRTGPFLVLVRWADMQASELCDGCDCSISSSCRGVLVVYCTLLLASRVSRIVCIKCDIFFKFRMEQFHDLMLRHDKVSWSSWYHARLIGLILTCGSIFWEKKQNTDLKCKTNYHSARFNSAWAAVALSCTNFGYGFLYQLWSQSVCTGAVLLRQWLHRCKQAITACWAFRVWW